jgi:hypothetical protein
VLGGVLPRLRRVIDRKRDVGNAVAVLLQRFVERRFTAVWSIENESDVILLEDIAGGLAVSLFQATIACQVEAINGLIIMSGLLRIADRESDMVEAEQLE